MPQRSSVEESERYAKMVKYLPRLRRFAYGLTGTMDAANELVQRTYERAFVRSHQWQEGTRLDSWLFKILQSIRYNDLQADRVRGGHHEPLDPDTQVSPEGTGRIEAQMQLESVNAMLLRLPVNQRQVLLLVAVENFSYREAADVLGIPIGTLTSRLSRARSTLIANMQEDNT